MTEEEKTQGQGGGSEKPPPVVVSLEALDIRADEPLQSRSSTQEDLRPTDREERES